MTVSNDERRKIAERLRGIDTSEDPCNSALLFKGIAEAVGTWATWKGKPPHALPTYEWHVAQNWKLLNRLANLIEPGPERTCRVEHIEYGELFGTRAYKLTCGDTVAGSLSQYCPHCGAKVVGDV